MCVVKCGQCKRTKFRNTFNRNIQYHTRWVNFDHSYRTTTTTAWSEAHSQPSPGGKIDMAPISIGISKSSEEISNEKPKNTL